MTLPSHTADPTASSQKVSDDPSHFKRQKRVARTRLTPWRFKWLMRLYPPLLANGVRATEVSDDFRTLKVKLKKTLLNTNFNGAIFGGTITAAFDPWIGVMYWQVLTHHGFQPMVVNYALNVRFKRPATKSLWMRYSIPEADVKAAVAALNNGEKFVKSYFVDATDSRTDGEGQVVATAEVVIHLRAKKPAGTKQSVSF